MNDSRHLEFKHRGPFLIVTDLISGVQLRINKSNMLVQKDNDTTFFLKNDTYIAYYNHNQISTPVTENLDELLDLITTWVSNASIQNNEYSTCGTTTGVGKVCSGKMSIAMQASNATSSNLFGDSVVVMTLDNDATNSKIVRQTACSHFVFGGTYCAILNGTLLNSNSTSNVVSRIGVFDDASDVYGSTFLGNGMFFENSNDSMSIVYRTSISNTQVDTKIPQSNWNLDPLDGTGPSGARISASNATNFVFEWNNHSVRKAGILHQNQTTNSFGPIFCHAFSNDVPFFGNASLPARWEMFHDSLLGSDSISGSMSQGDVIVTTNIYDDPEPYEFSKSDFPDKSISQQNETAHVLTLRINPKYIKSRFRIKSMKFLNTTQGGIGKWEIMQNGRLSDPESEFFDCDNVDSRVQFSTNSSRCSSGDLLSSGFIFGMGQETCSAPLDWISSSSIEKIPDTISLRVTLIAGVLSLSTIVSWEEL